MDIFSGAQPPAWLQARAARDADKEHGQWGQVAGTLAGGLLNSFRRDEEAPIDPETGKQPRQGFMKGLYEARMNQQDPMWKLKTAQTKAAWMAQAAQAESAHAIAQERIRDFKGMIEDGPTLAKLAAMPPDEFEKQAPSLVPAGGWRGTSSLSTFIKLQDQKADQKAAALNADVRREAGNVARTRETMRNDFENAKLKIISDPANPEAEMLSQLEKNGTMYSRNADGTSTIFPSIDAQTAVRKWQIRNNETPLGTPESIQKQVISGKQAAQRQVTAQSNAMTLMEARSKLPTSQVKNVDQISEWNNEALKAEQSGDTAKANDLRQKSTLLQDTIKKGGIEIGYDNQGRMIVSIGAKAPTVATQSNVQGKELQYENATQLMQYLEENLNESHVGLAGNIGEMAVDRTLEQLIPGVANKQRIGARTTLMALREGLMREISDDKSGRFSVQDREEIGKALPTTGVFESLADAKARIERVREILSDRGRVYSKRLGEQPPLWALSKEEIIQQYQQNKITKDDAADALVRFHSIK